MRYTPVLMYEQAKANVSVWLLYAMAVMAMHDVATK
jgi:hypothetical protein